MTVILPFLSAPGLLYTDHIPFWMGMIISGLFFVLAFRMIFKSLFRANIEIITTEEGERLSAMHISPGQLLILIVSSVIIVSLLLLFLTL